MEKKLKHEKAEKFRAEITTSASRAGVIRNLVEKAVYDETDELKISILFQKTSLTDGCEKEYTALIAKLIGGANEAMKEKASGFYRKWKQ